MLVSSLTGRAAADEQPWRYSRSPSSMRGKATPWMDTSTGRGSQSRPSRLHPRTCSMSASSLSCSPHRLSLEPSSMPAGERPAGPGLMSQALKSEFVKNVSECLLAFFYTYTCITLPQQGTPKLRDEVLPARRTTRVHYGRREIGIESVEDERRSRTELAHRRALRRNRIQEVRRGRPVCLQPALGVTPTELIVDDIIEEMASCSVRIPRPHARMPVSARLKAHDSRKPGTARRKRSS